jgi:hydrogenase maturation factor HypE
MDEIAQHDIGLFRRELRDVRAVVANIDHRTRKLIEPVVIHRPAGLVARYAACKLIAIKEKRTPEAIAKQHFADDRDLAHLIELKAAVTPAMTTVKPAAAG